MSKDLDVHLVEIDRSKKYILLADEVSENDLVYMSEKLRRWLDEDNAPLVIIDMSRLKLVEVEKEDE